MLTKTDAVLRLEQTTAVLALEKTLMAAEQASGIGWEGATRPLYAHERNAKVRFGDIHTLMNRGAAEIQAVLASLTEVIHIALYDAMDGVDTIAGALPATMLLRARQPEAVITAEIQAAKLIEGILVAVFQDASNIAIQEARRQGMTGLYGRAPLAPARAEFLPGATAAAMGPWNSVLAAFQIGLLDTKFLLADPKQRLVSELATRRVSTAGRKGRKFGSKVKLTPSAYRPGIKAPGEILDLVDTAVEKSAARTRDTAKQEVHLAHGKGRNRTARKLKANLIWASELLDGKTCENCAKIDGREYRTIAAGRKDYPFGPYKNCLGGNRCRGTLVFLYEEPAAPVWD